MEPTDKLTPWERELIEEAFRRQHNTLIGLAEQMGVAGSGVREALEEFDSAVAKVRRLIGNA